LPHLDVYGQDHSPWVQAVLLGLYEKRVSYTITTLPPLSLFRKSGIMMPAASIDGGRWQLQSDKILQQVDYDAVSPEDMGAIYAAWGGVAHRVDSAPRFWNEFSFICDPHPSLLPRLRNHFLRSFAVLYFYLLINFMVLTRRQGDPESFADQFRYWEQKLGESKGDYLGGEEPGILDVMLFGVIQCHCSILVPPIPALQEDPALARLRTWLGIMQERFANYPHLYSGVYFAPNSPPPARSSRLDRSAFWFGSAFMLLAFPITIPLILFFARRIRWIELKARG
jgi:glutathione S-transferase